MDNFGSPSSAWSRSPPVMHPQRVSIFQGRGDRRMLHQKGLVAVQRRDLYLETIGDPASAPDPASRTISHSQEAQFLQYILRRSIPKHAPPQEFLYRIVWRYQLWFFEAANPISRSANSPNKSVGSCCEVDLEPNPILETRFLCGMTARAWFFIIAKVH